ncbi:MAG: hypothetical protein ACLT1W_11880 [Alistipes onderdonkii]
MTVGSSQPQEPARIGPDEFSPLSPRLAALSASWSRWRAISEGLEFNVMMTLRRGPLMEHWRRRSY